MLAHAAAMQAAARCAPSPARLAAGARPAGAASLPCRRRPARLRGGAAVAMAGKESRLKKSNDSPLSVPVRGRSAFASRLERASRALPC